ncbi:flagellar hook-length control protein FliK [Halomonas sp. HP20-15]|uniref:flagellar hook-length control protein FliK n=1 Tax=Halomonas sp. HP20-15 TaxID=3085901 RepID=UPI002981608D|nr:flagellar hook-length control protein FliK [Halomonas sp. HP20-15]MDW5375685.1 flagellar hook-length control protein FliK [Halomonas sp. HP20-15]
MSGVVTPLIDTLLHQVLGKRSDVPSNLNVLEPVKPMTPGSALQALKSDSRLESGRAGSTLLQPGFKEGESSTPRQLPAAPSSTATHFSPAARTIADILVKFPAPPSVISPATPLLAKPDVANVPLVAAGLQNSIEGSGLFYESHLARWFRGELPRAILMREPQMRVQLQRGVLPGGSERTSRGDMSALAQARLMPMTAPRGEGQAPAPLAPPATSAVGGRGASGAADEAMRMTADAGLARDVADNMRPHESADDALQRVVRHQLELLVTPTLRWEGDVWAGLFMALTLQLPAGLQERDAQGEQGGEDELPWHSRISLRLANLGELDVQLQLYNRSLTLAIHTDQAASMAALKRSQATFEERLYQCGFESVRVSVLPGASDSTGAVSAEGPLS